MDNLIKSKLRLLLKTKQRCPQYNEEMLRCTRLKDHRGECKFTKRNVNTQRTIK